MLIGGWTPLAWCGELNEPLESPIEAIFSLAKDRDRDRESIPWEGQFEGHFKVARCAGLRYGFIINAINMLIISASRILKMYF